MTYLIAIFALLGWSRTEPKISPKYAYISPRLSGICSLSRLDLKLLMILLPGVKKKRRKKDTGSPWHVLIEPKHDLGSQAGADGNLFKEINKCLGWVYRP